MAVASAFECTAGGAIVDEDVELGVRGAKHASAIEIVAGPSIPEVVEVENGEECGGVAGFHPAQALEERDRVSVGEGVNGGELLALAMCRQGRYPVRDWTIWHQWLDRPGYLHECTSSRCGYVTELAES